MMHRSIYSLRFAFSSRKKKGKAVKGFPFSILVLDYDLC